MKVFLRIVSLALPVALLVGSLVSCGEEVPPEETLPDTPPATAAPTELSTDPSVESGTAGETAPTTDPATETETEPETESIEPNVLPIAALPADASGFAMRGKYCKVALAEDADGAQVLRISSSRVNTTGSIPETYLSLSSIATALGVEVPATTAYPYMVIKVRAGQVWSHLFSLHGGKNAAQATPANAADMDRVRLRMTDDWQYICFDFSEETENMESLYLQFEYGAGEGGEYVDIAEFRFLSTAEEADALCGSDTYEVEEADDVLRIISYNIWVGNGTDTTMRADILRDLIEEYRPDSIGMQEVNTAWRTEFESFVFNDSYAGVGEGRGGGYEACLIYYRTDKYELVDSGTFWLSDTPDVVGSAFPDSSYPRICTWAHLRDRVTGYEYMHINTHLDHLGNETGHNVRAEQIKVLLNFVAGLGDLPLVMTGDFNSASQNSKGEPYKAYAYITGEPFQNAAGETITSAFADTRLHAAETVPADRTATMTKYHDENDSAYNPSRLPIDYQFYIPAHFEPLSYDTVIWERDGVPVSDHLALICEYRILQND